MGERGEQGVLAPTEAQLRPELRTPAQRTVSQGRPAFISDTLTGTGLPARMPVAATAATIMSEPTKLPKYDQNQLCIMPPTVACFS